MELLIRRIERKICALWDRDSNGAEGIGSGALVSAADRHLILTCAHVALPFISAKEARVVLIGGTVIPRDRCRLHYADKKGDIALIEVDDKRLAGFSIDEVASIPDYTQHDFSHTDLFVCGFPGEQVRVEQGRHKLFPMAFLTGIQDSPARTRETMACAYPMGHNLVQGQDGLTGLPRPHGLSGSPLLGVPSPRTPRNEIWTFEDIRIVGVVATSNVRTYLEANSCFSTLQIMRA